MEKTVKVYSIPISVMKDYSRSGIARYGTPDDLSRNVQTLTITKDRAFNFIIDAGDKVQSQNVMDAGKALNRQMMEVVGPEFDTYVFKTLADAAVAAGGYASAAIDKTNAYASFLAGMEYLGDNHVPDVGRICFSSYKFANYMMQDPAFVKYGDRSQEMVIKGILGEIDGCKIVKVPSGHLPAGAAFIITHTDAAVGPKQLEEYRIHDNPPGISGWLVEGRVIYDCFVLNEKRTGIYYHGGQSILKMMNILTAATAVGKTTILVNGVKSASANTWYYKTAASVSDLPALAFGTAITSSDYKVNSLSTNVTEITPTSGHKVVRVVEVGTDDKPIAFGDAVINVGE